MINSSKDIPNNSFQYDSHLLKELIAKLSQEHQGSKEELLLILKNITPEIEEVLYYYADKVRRENYNNQVYMRGLIEFSNYCKRNCAYCGIRRGNANAERYRLNKEEILACCQEGYDLGYRTFVLQSGEDPYFNDELLTEIIKEIKNRFPECAITLSIGERSYESYLKLKQAGTDRYLLRHETASETLYKALHPDMSFTNRRDCLQRLKELDYQVGAGFMVGLPGQTEEDLVEDLLYLQELKPHMVGIGPFIPHPDTPLGELPPGALTQTLTMVALTRLLLPKVLLPATTALGSLDPKGREKGLKAGANVVMPNLSPVSVRPKYELYKGKICTGDEAAHCRSCIERRINDTGYEVTMDRGDVKDWGNDNVY